MNPEYKTLLGALRGLINAVRKHSIEDPILLRRKKNPMVFLLVAADEWNTLSKTDAFKPWEVGVQLTPQDIIRLGAVLQIDLFRKDTDASPS